MTQVTSMSIHVCDCITYENLQHLKVVLLQAPQTCSLLGTMLCYRCLPLACGCLVLQCLWLLYFCPMIMSSSPEMIVISFSPDLTLTSGVSWTAVVSTRGRMYCGITSWRAWTGWRSVGATGGHWSSINCMCVFTWTGFVSQNRSKIASNEAPASTLLNKSYTVLHIFATFLFEQVSCCGLCGMWIQGPDCDTCWFVCRQNSILADEMGLGKTIQSISFLSEVQVCEFTVSNLVQQLQYFRECCYWWNLALNGSWSENINPQNFIQENITGITPVYSAFIPVCAQGCGTSPSTTQTAWTRMIFVRISAVFTVYILVTLLDDIRVNSSCLPLWWWNDVLSDLVQYIQ